MRRVVIVHDYLTQRGGAERVVLSMLKAFPGAPLYTSLYDPPTTGEVVQPAASGTYAELTATAPGQGRRRP